MRMLLSLLVTILCACASSQGKEPRPESSAQVVPDDVAYFAGGCFWGVEHFLQELDGVASVESGYAGGKTQTPGYKDVLRGDTGHLETVRVRFDSKRVSFRELAKRFFEIHDPTQTDGQGPDIGAQYHSAVFYTSAAQKASTEALIKKLEERGYAVATEVRAFDEFWLAEDYHQDHYAKSGEKPYCHRRIKRFGDDH